MVERVDHLRVPHDHANLKLKRAASYTKLKIPIPRHSRWQGKPIMCGSDAYITSVMEDRIRSISPTKTFSHLHPSQREGNSRLSDLQKNCEGKPLKIFELKRTSVNTDDQSPPLKTRENNNDYESALEAPNACVQRMRSLRFKNITDDFGESEPTLHKNINSFGKLKNPQVTRKESDYSGNTTTSGHSGAYYKSYHNSGVEVFHRRKQPRQAKKYLEMSKEPLKYHKSSPDAVDEPDMTSKEYLNEYPSKESPLKQPCHQTKVHLNLNNINVESQLKREVKTPEMMALTRGQSVEKQFEMFASSDQREERWDFGRPKFAFEEAHPEVRRSN